MAQQIALTIIGLVAASGIGIGLFLVFCGIRQQVARVKTESSDYPNFI